MKLYLGDSVYAEWNETDLILTTENGLPNDPSNTIALEGGVLAALDRYRERINNILKMIKENKKEKTD